ncbi:MAG: MaoC/PaaZ C-terminal domain-containing protein [Legionella sp.]
MNYIENRVFDEIKVGDSASLKRILTQKDIKLFAIMSGDINPAHVDAEYAKNYMFHQIIAHGMWGASLLSTVLGTELPGPGTIYLDQTLQFKHHVLLGDEITVMVTVQRKDSKHHQIVLDCHCSNQSGKTVISGVATVIAPTPKVKRKRIKLPEIEFKKAKNHWYHDLIATQKHINPLKTGVVHPVDALSLKGAIAAA